jgi:hypothetical protein
MDPVMMKRLCWWNLLSCVEAAFGSQELGVHPKFKVGTSSVRELLRFNQHAHQVWGYGNVNGVEARMHG